MNPKRDPLDSGKPGQKEWEEFRSRFAAAMVFKWLVADLANLRPAYVRELAKRLESAELDFDKTLEYSGEPSDLLPITGPNWPEDMSITMMLTRGELQELKATLFPHGHRNVELAESARGAVLLLLHSALEAYAKSIGAHERGRLPENIRSYLRSMDSKLFDQLVDVDAVRHLVVHGAGIVDEDYLRRAVAPQWQRGERRIVSQTELDDWARAMETTAVLMRDILFQQRAD